LREEILRSKGEELYPCQQEYLRRRRPYVEDGDLLALFSALQRCRQPVRRGFSYEDARLNPQLDPNEPVSEIPRWLLDAALKLLWRGLFNEWPTGEARHARTARKAYDMRKDLIRTAHFLKARDDKMAFEDALEYVANKIEGAGSLEAVRAAYQRVAKAFDEDPTPYLFLPRPVPKEWLSGLPGSTTD
jgi:hypothetical protein